MAYREKKPPRNKNRSVFRALAAIGSNCESNTTQSLRRLRLQPLAIHLRRSHVLGRLIGWCDSGASREIWFDILTLLELMISVAYGRLSATCTHTVQLITSEHPMRDTSRSVRYRLYQGTPVYNFRYRLSNIMKTRLRHRLLVLYFADVEHKPGPLVTTKNSTH